MFFFSFFFSSNLFTHFVGCPNKHIAFVEMNKPDNKLMLIYFFTDLQTFSQGESLK
jgi:hypothetical protein